jgi:hypothetical protein
MSYHGIAWVFAGLLTGCATITVERVTTKTESDGLLYALPNTVVRLQLKVDRSEKSGAPYAEYAAIFAPDGKPVCKDHGCSQEQKITYALEPGATLTTYGEPDQANIYVVKFTGGGLIDQSLSMTWNEAGLLSTASASVTNRSIDVATSGLKLLTNVGTKIFAGAVGVKPEKTPSCPGANSATDSWAIPILLKAGDPSSVLITNYCAISKDTRDALFRDDTVLNSAVAAYVAKVVPLASARTNILNGTNQTLDPATLLTKIETELDQELTTLYIGKSTTQTWDGTLDVRNISVQSPVPVLGLDAATGICVRDAGIPPASKPIPANFTVLGAPNCEAARAINVVFQFYPSADKQLFSKISDTVGGKRSFRYRIPAQVSANIGDGGKTSYGAAILSVAQLGTVISLPANRHSKMLSYDLAFVEATGALKSFKLGTTGGFDSSTLDALSSAGGTVLDARSAAQKSASEAAALTQQDQLLKLQDDICTIQKKYGLKCTVQP